MTRLFIIFGFAVAFCAGLMLGLSYRQPSPEPASSVNTPLSDGGPRGPGGRASWIVQQLDLTPQQHEQLKEIWSDTARRGSRHHGEQRYELRRQRDEAIQQLIRAEDRAGYDQIVQDYENKVSAIETEWRKSFDTAVEKTKDVLTPEQREKYESLLNREGWDGKGGKGPPPFHRFRGTSGPSSREREN